MRARADATEIGETSTFRCSCFGPKAISLQTATTTHVKTLSERPEWRLPEAPSLDRPLPRDSDPQPALDYARAGRKKFVSELIEFLRFPSMNDADPRAIWNSPTGAKVAWFHDPDKNVLSLTQF